MIAQLLKRIKAKWNYHWFALVYAPNFLKVGKNSFMHFPFRLDGAQSISLGNETVLQRSAWLYCCPVDLTPASLTIGAQCVFGYNNHITAVHDVEIEDHVLTANNVFISDNVHSYENIDTPIIQQPVRFKGKVVIGRGSWIGENVSIIGASVGRNCVIGANSVVTHDIPDFSVAAGAPAVVIRKYDPPTQTWVRQYNTSQNDL